MQRQPVRCKKTLLLVRGRMNSLSRSQARIAGFMIRFSSCDMTVPLSQSALLSSPENASQPTRYACAVLFTALSKKGQPAIRQTVQQAGLYTVGSEGGKRWVHPSPGRAMTRPLALSQLACWLTIQRTGHYKASGVPLVDATSC